MNKQLPKNLHNISSQWHYTPAMPTNALVFNIGSNEGWEDEGWED